MGEENFQPSGITVELERVVDSPDESDGKTRGVLFMRQGLASGELPSGRKFEISATFGAELLVEFEKEEVDETIIGRDRFILRPEPLIQQIAEQLEARPPILVCNSCGSEDIVPTAKSEHTAAERAPELVKAYKKVGEGWFTVELERDLGHLFYRAENGTRYKLTATGTHYADPAVNGQIWELLTERGPFARFVVPSE